MSHLYYVTPDFAITLDDAEMRLIDQGYKPYVPRPIREHLGLLKATPALIKTMVAGHEQNQIALQFNDLYSHSIEAIESSLDDLHQQEEELFDEFWNEPSPITDIIDEAMDRYDVIGVQFDPIEGKESLTVHSPLPIVQLELPF